MRCVKLMSFPLILDHALPGAHPDRPKRLWLLFLLGVGVWLPVACGAAPEPNLEKADSYTLAPRLRVVTLSPSATRFVLALGGKALLVGVDSASKDLPGTEQLPSVSLESVRPLAPDLIVGPKLDLEVVPSDSETGPGAAEYVEYAPHNLEDVFELCRTLGRRLVGHASATQFEREISRPLAAIGGASFGEDRPRVLGVTGLDPMELAGGHSFATDFIEIAGGSSVTHGGENYRLAPDAGTWQRLAPDLVLFVSKHTLTPVQRDAARRALPSEYPTLFFPFDPDGLSLTEFADVARRLRMQLKPQQGTP